MQLQYLILQIHDKELFLQSCVVAECNTASKNILNKTIQEDAVGNMHGAELAYKRHIQTNNVLPRTAYFLLEE
jgi:hypothetical protein